MRKQRTLRNVTLNKREIWQYQSATCHSSHYHGVDSHCHTSSAHSPGHYVTQIRYTLITAISKHGMCLYPLRNHGPLTLEGGAHGQGAARTTLNQRRARGGKASDVANPPLSLADTPLAPNPRKPSQSDPVARQMAALTELPPKPG